MAFRGNTKERNPKPHNRVAPPFRRLTPEEVAQHKADDLCFQCSEPWHRRHLCERKELRLLLVQDNGDERELEEDEEFPPEEVIQEATAIAELSLNSMVGLSSPRTIKLRATIQGEVVVVMIDCGATHNFISARLVQHLQISTEVTGGYGVVTGTGLTVQGQGVCKGLTLQLPGITLISDFLPLELGSADVILGMQWLETLGEMRCNWKLQRLRFKWEGQRVILQGIRNCVVRMCL